jgi:hypothetical protein
MIFFGRNATGGTVDIISTSAQAGGAASVITYGVIATYGVETEANDVSR